MIRVKCLYTVYIYTKSEVQFKLPLFIGPMMDIVSYQLL